MLDVTVRDLSECLTYADAYVRDRLLEEGFRTLVCAPTEHHIREYSPLGHTEVVVARVTILNPPPARRAAR